MSKHGDDLVALRDLLNVAGARLGLSDAVELGHVWGRWEQIVGPQIAAHAEPTSLRGRVLRVRADSPVWATEIGYLAADIAARVNDAVGRDAVESVRVWTGPRAARAEPSRTPYRGGPARPEPGAVRGPATDVHGALQRAHAAWRRLARRRK